MRKNISAEYKALQAEAFQQNYYNSYLLVLVVEVLLIMEQLTSYISLVTSCSMNDI